MDVGWIVARLTVEDCWWTDPRRSALVSLFGEMETDYMAVRAWKLAQEFWKAGRGLVPRALFELIPNASELVRVGLAEHQGEMVYVRGSSSYLDWLAEQREKASEAGKRGGLVSAQRPRDGKGRLLPNAVQAESKHSPSKGVHMDDRGQKPPSDTPVFSENRGGEWADDDDEVSLTQVKVQTLSKQSPSKVQADPSKPKLFGSSSYSGSYKKEEAKPTTTTSAREESATLKLQIGSAYETWIQTLKHFEISNVPAMNIPDEQNLARAIKQLGFENVCLALEGQRFEPVSDRFKPSQHLSIHRALHKQPDGKSQWEKFRNLALGNRSRQTETGQGLAIVPFNGSDFTEQLRNTPNPEYERFLNDGAGGS